MAVVRFDDFDIVAGGQGLGRHLQQLERDIDAHTHVGRHHDRDVLGRRGDFGLLRLGEAGGADHRMHAVGSTGLEMLQRAFGPREIDQHPGGGQACGQIGGDDRAGRMTEKTGRELTNGRAAGDVQRAGELAIVSRNHGFDEHVAHATGGTGHSHLMKGVRVHVDRGRRGRRIIPAADRHRG